MGDRLLTMMLLCLLALLAFASADAGINKYRDQFEAWQQKHGKSYTTTQESKHRLAAFAFNARFVEQHDAEARGFAVALNEFADLTIEEFVALYTGMNITAPAVTEFTPSPAAGEVDWRKKGAVTPVKNQGQCGSCWAFSITGSTEAAHFLATGKLVSLSEQNLVDCSVSYGNHGCNGGLMDNAFKYIINNKGVDTESSYPYQARGPLTCKFSGNHVGATLKAFHDVLPRQSESSLHTSVTARPVSVAIDAGHSSFQLYHSGVYYEPSCSQTRLDHGVLAVGYGSDNNKDYWIVKNSWGANWGQQGYIWMARNRNNNCGIATMASFPTA